ncbi:TetR/AcrR family transcriptional regulator [Sphingomonas flavalba]|uniref:TetR/AcrR family transcriptional regulator n=1 Tax=Sphingomonas flavalba TaxID=2559804 RepID=UPI0039E13040
MTGTMQEKKAGRPRDAGKDALIADAMLRMLAKHGYEGASFEKVAAKAKVSRASIYRRWRSKEDLVIHAIGEMLRAEARDGADITGTGIPAIRQMLTRTAERLSDPFKRRVIAAVLSEAASRPALAALGARLEQERRTPLLIALTQARADGSLPSGQTDEYLADALAGALYFRALVAQTPLTDAVIDGLIASVLQPSG